MTNTLTGYKKLSINDLKKFEYIRNAAIFFKDHFLSKEMIYSTEKETTSVIFKRSNFMHFVEYIMKLVQLSFLILLY